MKFHKLLDAVEASGPGSALTVNPMRVDYGRTYPILITGIAAGDVVQLEVCTTEGGTYVPLDGGEFTEDGAWAIASFYPFIRANVTTYVSGTITVEIGV
ncbi:hypothetical protein ACFL6N_06145 [Thermodesulfobacteriota bacterium]